MTSLAALVDWLAAARAGSRPAARGRGESDFRLRALPREDIHVFVKAIDNTQAAPLSDRRDWCACIGMAGSVVIASVLLIALLMPGGYSLLAGRRMEQLRAEREALTNELRTLRSREAALLSPSQLDRWAGPRFVSPAAAAVIFAPPSRGAVASLDKR